MGSLVSDVMNPSGRPLGLCGDKKDHEQHEHESKSLGKFWCHADQQRRLPYAAEMRRKTL